MIVNPKMPFDRERARAYFEKLMSSGVCRLDRYRLDEME